MDNNEHQTGDVGMLVGLIGFVLFGVLGLVDEGGEVIWWLLSCASVVVLLSGMIHSAK